MKTAVNSITMVLIAMLAIALPSCVTKTPIDQVSEVEFMNANSNNAPNSHPVDTVKLRRLRRAAYIMIDYCYLKDNQYYTTLSKEEAKKLGILEEDYDYQISTIETTNATIREYLSKGVNVDLFDPQTMEKDSTDIFSENKIITRDNDAQYGWLIASDTQEATGGFYPEIGKTSVDFHCRANVAIAATYVCKVKIWGEELMNTGHGSSSYNTTVNVPLAAAGSWLCTNLTFMVSDPKGASTLWVAMPNVDPLAV